MPVLEPSVSRMPIELVENIIDNYSRDTTFLAACSLVCQFWSAIARRYLFREVRTGPRSTSLVCDPTSTVLPYVRYLHFTGDDEGYPPWISTSGSGCLRMLDTILQTIRIAELTALETLRADYVEWSTLSPPARRALQQLCTRVTSLHLVYPFHWSCDFLQPLPCSAVAQLLGTATSLKHFTLTISTLQGFCIRLREEEVDTETRDSWRKDPVLDSFEIGDHSPSYLSRLSTFFPEIRLRKLTLGGIRVNGLIPLVTILGSSSSVLEFLILGFSSRTDGTTEAALLSEEGGFPPTPALRELKLTGISMRAAPTLLQNTRSPGLDRLIIETDWNVYEDGITSDLAESLSTGAFAIARPHVTIDCSSCKKGDKQIIRDLYFAALPTLYREGRLRILPETAEGL